MSVSSMIACRSCGCRDLYSGIGGCGWVPEGVEWWPAEPGWAVARWRGADGATQEVRSRAENLFCGQCHLQVLPPSRNASMRPFIGRGMALPQGA